MSLFQLLDIPLVAETIIKNIFDLDTLLFLIQLCKEAKSHCNNMKVAISELRLQYGRVAPIALLLKRRHSKGTPNCHLCGFPEAGYKHYSSHVNSVVSELLKWKQPWSWSLSGVENAKNCVQCAAAGVNLYTIYEWCTNKKSFASIAWEKCW